MDCINKAPELEWQPQEGDKFFSISCDCSGDCAVYEFIFDIRLDSLELKLKNYFQTRAEAEKYLEKYKAWQESEPITDWRTTKDLWKPKRGDPYFFIINGTVIDLPWIGDSEDAIQYKIGNCFYTTTEALENITAYSQWLKGEPIVDWRK